MLHDRPHEDSERWSAFWGWAECGEALFADLNFDLRSNCFQPGVVRGKLEIERGQNVEGGTDTPVAL